MSPIFGHIENGLIALRSGSPNTVFISFIFNTRYVQLLSGILSNLFRCFDFSEQFTTISIYFVIPMDYAYRFDHSPKFLFITQLNGDLLKAEFLYSFPD